MDDAVAQSNFLNRLTALQNLCSDSDPNFPNALLFVAGQDGRFNKGSITLLKYLFRGCVSKELFDETLDETYEQLEDLVIFIQSSSVSIILSTAMKKLLSPMYSFVPNLVEYLSTEEEEREIDSMQARKCCDFKRMMLESVREGGGVGIPVPIGYDDVQDIESWPLLQSFALDHVFAPTGFFTARYTVADITEHLEILFRSVDGYYVDNAVAVMYKTVHPHMLQAINMLDAPTADQRARVTGEDAVGPLEVLYEFGELDAAGSPDPAARPVVLFGADSAAFAVSNGHYGDEWQRTVAGKSLHVVYEASEPSTGLRWCRTYFLRCGKAVDLISDADALVHGAPDDDDDNDGSAYERGDSKDAHDPISSQDSHYPHHSAEETACLRRLQGLYVKLWMGLRVVVRTAFANHTDVLEAGTYIQQRMDQLMTRRGAAQDAPAFSEEVCLQSLLPDVHLSAASERLQVHMDCMNAAGDVVAIEDVDDMGGACWTYIRVSVHGVALAGGRDTATVAVGDTFLFSSNATRSTTDLAYALEDASTLHALPLLHDGFCVTHPLPYYRSFLGSGAEERAALRLIACAKNPSKLKMLGLGKPLAYAGSGTVSLPLLTDHAAMPLVESADVRLFSEGLLVERMDGSSAPLLLSIGTHVERVWIVDGVEVMEQTNRLPPASKISSLPGAAAPAGLLVVFRLKDSAGPDSDSGEALFRHNPLDRTMPLIASDLSSGRDEGSAARHVAIFVQSSCRAAAAMTPALAAWRVACRVHDVQEHRGADVSLPVSVLRAFTTLIDVWGSTGARNGNEGDSSAPEGSSAELLLTAESLVSTAAYCSQNPSLQLPGTGYLSMRCMHAISEAKRLQNRDSSPDGFVSLTPQQVQAARKDLTKRTLTVLTGHVGSGVVSIGTQLRAQLEERLGRRSRSLHTALVDLADFSLQNGCSSSPSDQLRQFLSSRVQQRPRGETPDSVLVILTLSAAVHCRLPDLLSALSVLLSATLVSALSVIAPASVQFGTGIPGGYSEKPLSESRHGLGHESWKANVVQLLEPGCCDSVIAVADPHSRSSYGAMRALLSEANPSAAIVRLSSSSLRLDEETVDQVVQALLRSRSSKATVLSQREAWRAMSGGQPDYLVSLNSSAQPRRLSVAIPYIPASVGSGLRSIALAPVGTQGEWNLANVTRALQVLFPSAKLSAPTVEDTWSAPVLKESQHGHFSRLLDRARAKVLTARQDKESRRCVEAAISLLEKRSPDRLRAIVENIRSVHGTLVVKAGIVASSGHDNATGALTHRQNTTLVEACRGFVAMRPAKIDSAAQSRLVVEGLFSADDVAVLTDLFAQCCQVRLPRREHVRASDLSDEDKRRVVQSDPKYNARPLPGNVWFDGHSYVDIRGSRSLLRPDMALLVEEYLQDENSRIDKYNAQLKDF